MGMALLTTHMSTQYGKGTLNQTTSSTYECVPKKKSTMVLHICTYEDRSYLYHYQSNLDVTNPLPAQAARTERGHTTTVPREQAGSNEYESFTVIFCFSMR